MKKFLKELRKYDQFGPPVELNFRGKGCHQTYLGAVCTIIVYPFLILIAFYSILFFNYDSKDIVINSSVIYPFSDPADGIFLNETGDAHLNFKLYVNDNEFDNDDNPYG